MNLVEVHMDFITDIHSLVWYFTEDARLSKKAIKVFEGTIKEGTVVVPAVVLAEIMYISKRGKIALSFEETVKKIEEYENFDIAPLDINILKKEFVQPELKEKSATEEFLSVCGAWEDDRSVEEQIKVIYSSRKSSTKMEKVF